MEGAFLEILDLFTDCVTPGKRDEFAAVLWGVLGQLDLQPKSDVLSKTL